MKSRLLHFIVLWITAWFPLQDQSQATEPIKRNRISERVVVYEYLNVNVTAVKSIDGILIIDSHRSPATMTHIMQAIENDFGSNNFLYVINTHSDHDHSSGNQVFPHSSIIGQDNCPTAMRQLPTDSPEMISYIQSKISDMVGQEEMNAELETWKQLHVSIEEDYRVTPPDKTFRDSLTLHMNDLTVSMAYCGNAHTDNDIIIYIPEEGLVFTGDLFTSKYGFGFSVNPMNDVHRVLSVMEHILKDPAGVKQIIPGHGQPFPGEDLLNIHNRLKDKFEKFNDKSSAVKLLESLIVKDGIKKALIKYSTMQVSKNTRHYQSEEEYSILGSRYLRKGMFDEAIGVFVQSIKAFPKSALGYDNLGEAYYKKGIIDSARINYRKSLKIFPENRNTQEILKRIDRSR